MSNEFGLLQITANKSVNRQIMPDFYILFAIETQLALVYEACSGQVNLRIQLVDQSCFWCKKQRLLRSGTRSSAG